MCIRDSLETLRTNMGPTLLSFVNENKPFAPDFGLFEIGRVCEGVKEDVYKRQDQTRMTWEEDLNCWFPHLSPDGTQVAYIAYKKGDVEPGDHPAHKNVEIRVMDAGGQNTRVLAKLFGGQGTLNVNSWSPDGKKLAFVSYRLK